MRTILQDRMQAGRLLAERLQKYAVSKDVIVVALPRGGAGVAFEIAKALRLPLDILLVRKLGTPGQPELAMGAIAAGVQVLNDRVIREFDISPREIREEIAAESRELDRREKAYREARAPLEVRDRTVILVDDGVATGSTMEAAIAVLRHQGVKHLVVAVGVAPQDTLERMQGLSDEVVCLLAPPIFGAISEWYREFPQLTDEEVKAFLRNAMV